MTLIVGSRRGHYAVTARIGAGGIDEVYVSLEDREGRRRISGA